MKKSLISLGFLAVLSMSVYAEDAVQSTIPSPNPSTQEAPPSPQTTPVMNCQYRISAETSEVPPETLKAWVNQAAVQSFEFNPATIDTELENLKACFTDEGWKGFKEALEQSGNIKAIKAQNLMVSSQVDGEILIDSAKENEWKAAIPLSVVYQNDKDKLTQLLTVNLLIGRKPSGDLGIMQMIATPRNVGEPKTAPPTNTQPDVNQQKMEKNKTDTPTATDNQFTDPSNTNE